MGIATEVLTTERGNEISYFLHCPPLMGCFELFERLQAFELRKDSLDEWSKDMFKKQMERDLAMYELDIPKILNENHFDS